MRERKTKTKQKLDIGFNSAKNERKLLELLIYSLYSNAISYRDQLYADIVDVFMHGLLLHS